MKRKRQIGSSNLYLPPVGLGCGTLGDPDEVISEAQAQNTLSAAWDGGLRYFDTAPWYGNTKSEHRAGYFLRQNAGQEFIISTKVGRVFFRPGDRQAFKTSPFMARWRGGLPFDLRFDYSHDGIMRSYEDSLTRLGLNRVDALAIHDLDLKHFSTPERVKIQIDSLEKQGGYRALRALKDAGEIAAIGVGINHPGMIPQFIERFEIDYFIVAMPYTLLDQTALDEDFPLCEKHGVSVIIGAVFASGILATGATQNAQYGYNPPTADIVQRMKTIETLCARYSVPLPAAALQFPLAHPLVASVIPGGNSPEQVRQNLHSLAIPIPADFWSELKSAGILRADAPTPA